MTYFHEKLFLGFGGIMAWTASTLGAIVVEDEALRYFYATLSMSILTAFFMALVFRKDGESIRLVIGRCGLSILLGVFGTRFAIHYFGLEQANTDIIMLMGLAGGVTIAGFLVGFALLKVINRKATGIAEKWTRKYFGDDEP